MMNAASEEQVVQHIEKQVGLLRDHYESVPEYPAKIREYVRQMQRILDAEGCSAALAPSRLALTEVLTFSIKGTGWTVRKLTKKGEGILRGVLHDFGEFQIMGKTHGFISSCYLRVLVESDENGEESDWTGIFVEPENKREGATHNGDIEDLGTAIKSLFLHRGEEIPVEVLVLLETMEAPDLIKNMYTIYRHPCTMSIPQKMELLFGVFAIWNGLDIGDMRPEVYLKRWLMGCTHRNVHVGIMRDWVEKLQNLPVPSSYERSWSKLKEIMGKVGSEEDEELNWVRPWHILKFIKSALDHPKYPRVRRGRQQEDFYVLFPTIFHSVMYPVTMRSSSMTLTLTEGSFFYSVVEESKSMGLLGNQTNSPSGIPPLEDAASLY